MRRFLVSLASGATLLLFGAAAEALVLTRYPAVWLQTPGSITITWQTDIASPGKVLYGGTPALGQERSHAGATMDHSVLVEGLSPAATYYYRIVSDTEFLTDGSDHFQTRLGPPVGRGQTLLPGSML